ncbi:TfoX/Sxy family DNA transformation protein [Photobacterium leiognathi]|uniref:TfoX/Sxy family DNA transformation protein n=1 Tax=Photobacterium leiognathi TaxID=553611 RepID=UPI0029821E15|nr:TfoX/Sxy family DNA transformation protein [Photobacterium leiognathi]
MTLLVDLFKLIKCAKDVVQILVETGFDKRDIRVSKMFGGEFIVIKGTQVFFLYRGNLFIKKPLRTPPCKKLLALPHQSIMVLSFKCIPETFGIQDICETIEFDHKEKQQKDPFSGQIRRMVNLDGKYERKLNQLNILTQNQLKQIGAINAFLMLRKSDPTLSINALKKLQGAIIGRQWQFVDKKWLDEAVQTISNS